MYGGRSDSVTTVHPAQSYMANASDLLYTVLRATGTSGALEHDVSGGHGQGHSAALCESAQPTCRLQSQPDCAKEDCANLISALVFPFFAIAIGIFLQPLTKYIRKLPYTVFLLLVGFLIGIVGCLTDLGILSTSLRQWIHLNPPNLFFYIFLAPLIFEAAFVTKWHIFKRLLIPILTAAFLIVIMQAGMIGGFTMLVTNPDHGWTWWSALMFGAMLSATDPISVTATLKSLGASENLGTMIEGESLVNDGSAFVLWETFFHNTEAQFDSSIKMYSIGDIVGIIAKSAIGGMLLGILFALVALIILNFVYDEFEVETSLTVVVAFLGFWTAQSPAKLSGVICNVASGLMLSAFGRPLISKSVRHPLSEFWELLGWTANTIVFVHSGILTIAFVWPCSATPLYVGDYFLILGFFAFLQVIRIALFMSFLPVLSFRNKWFTWKEDFVVGFSGLRGAVSLILALNVAGAAPIPSEIRSRIFVWTTGIVALSLLVNGMIIPVLLAYLGLDGADKTREEFLSRARATMTQSTLSTLDALCVDLSYTGARWSYVVKSVVPQKWFIDDKSGRHYALAAEQLQSNVGSHRRSLEFMVKEHNRASVEAELRSRTSTEMNPRAIGQHTTRLSLSSAPVNGIIAPPLTESEKKGTPRSAKSEQLNIKSPRLGGREPASIRTSRPFAVYNPVEEQGSYIPDEFLEVAGLGKNDQELKGRLRSDLEALRNRQGKALERIIVGRSDQESRQDDTDREIRRRMLMNMLSNIRHLSIHTFVEYSALVSLEDDVMTAIDENDEGRVQDLTKILGRKSLTSKIFGRFFEEGQFDAKLIAIAIVLFHITSEILKQEGLHRSELVLAEAENLYESAAFIINELSKENPAMYSWIMSQFAIHTVIAQQDGALHDMLHGGVIDEYEHKVLTRELQDVRRHHSVFTRRGWKVSRKAPSELVSLLPLFSDNNIQNFKEISKLPTTTLKGGEQFKPEAGTLVVVLRGSLLAFARTPSKVRTSFITPGGDSHDEISEVDNNLRTKGTMVGHGGSKRHWINSSYTGYIGADITCDLNNEVGESCPKAEDRLHENIFLSCDTAHDTTVFTLSAPIVRRIAKSCKTFRDEVTRFVARDYVLQSLQNDKPYDLRLINEALANKIDETTWSGRAFSLLEKLPYMNVVRLHAGETIGDTADGAGGQTTIHGPGLLVNGTVRVSIVDSSGLEGAVNLLHEHLEGPALLPAQHLIIQEVAGARYNASRNSELSTSDRIDKVEEILPNGTRADSRRPDGLGPVFAHVLVMEHASIEEIARARLRRWTTAEDTVDMNGRFGMTGHVSNAVLRKPVESEDKSAEGVDHENETESNIV